VTYLPRDFIETFEGLVFAVVDPRPEDGRILGFLRYVPAGGRRRKLNTAEAEAWLETHAPGYRHVSKRLGARLHGVPLAAVRRHYRPREKVRELRGRPPRDAIERKAVRLLALLMKAGLDPETVGLTGSVLIGAQTEKSDLDFVVYGREAFFAARAAVRRAIAAGDVQALDEAAWREAYERRGCALSFGDYLRHERRKFNKGLIEGTKFDLTLWDGEPDAATGAVRKLGRRVIRATVTDALKAFDFPSVYRLDHPDVGEALSFTQTYAGQAEAGETVEIAGLLEETESGRRRIVVGSSREAPGEYIRVVEEGSGE
jgi:predicted nucleotidyltransferase